MIIRQTKRKEDLDSKINYQCDKTIPITTDNFNIRFGFIVFK